METILNPSIVPSNTPPKFQGFDFYNFYTDDFNFNQFKPPFYSFESICLTVASYLLAIRLTTWYMFNKKPFTMKYISALHNFFLFVISVVMFFGVILGVVDLYFKGGSSAIMCNANGTYINSKLMFWIYVFYLTKPYEFVDTFIMIFKKRDLNFLHVWHHCTTFLLVWTTQIQAMNIQWISISANCFVHCFMYYYYFVSCLGYQVWWKRYLTLLQIVQFIITFSLNCYWAYAYYNGYNCAGTLFGFYFGMSIIFSFLLLFLKFYVDNYNSGKNVESPSHSPQNSPRSSKRLKKDE